jgi:hypothetical protein
MGRPGRPRLPVEQLGQRKRNRDQYRRDRDRIKFGSQGVASDVRKIDVASVDTAALVEQLQHQAPRPSPAKKVWALRRLTLTGPLAPLRRRTSAR